MGIELAATWIPMLSCQEIAQQIERDIDFLTVSVRDLPERHRSILSYAAFAQGKLAEARMHIGETLRLLEATGETWATIRCRTLLIAIVSAQGDLSEAERLARETLVLSRTLHDPSSEAQTLTELGVLALRQGQHSEAQRQLRESITLFKMLGDDFWLAGSLNHLGDTLYAAVEEIFNS